MPAYTTSSPPRILCPCGATSDYPIAIGLPPVGTEVLCVGCGKLWELRNFSFDDEGGTRWTWSSEGKPAGKMVHFAPLVAAPPTETVSAIAAAVVQAYREREWDDELTVNERVRS